MHPRAAALVVLVAAVGTSSAHHGDTLLPYVDAVGHFRAGLLAVGVGAPDDGDPVPPSGVGPVNYARLPFEPHPCHPFLQAVLTYAPANASVSTDEAYVAADFEFRLEYMDAVTGRRLASAPMSSDVGRAETWFPLTRADAEVPLRADLYLLRGAAADWNLSVRGWTHPTSPCGGPALVNEVEANPAGEDAGNEWVEILNPNVVPLDVSGWTVRATHGTPVSVTLPGGTVLAAEGRLVVAFPDGPALDDVDEVVVLEDALGVERDRTPALTDEADDPRTNQRVPEGTFGAWTYAEGTPGAANG